MRRYYDYKWRKEACVDYVNGPPPKSPEDAEFEKIYDAETDGLTMMGIKWAFQILFGG
jgi:hypothetical protein